MARLFQEQLKTMEQNPLYQLSIRVCNQLSDWIPESVIENMASVGMSPMQFSFYLVFETVAQWARDELQSETKTIYESVKETYDFSLFDLDKGRTAPTVDALQDYGLRKKLGVSEISRNHGGVETHDFSSFNSNKEKAEPLKDTLRDFGLRKEFLVAEMSRNHMPWNTEELKWMHKSGSAYRLTPMQLQQLHDKDTFYIKKVNELRRFRNPKHAPIDDVIAYYQSLIVHAEALRNEDDEKKRVISAINLNDFENRNISLFLYRAAIYCADLGIKKISSDIERSLLALTAVVSCGKTYKVTHKPVLFMQNYIPAAICGDASIIDLYVYLELEGLRIRKEVLYSWLDATQFTYQDIDDFIYKWSCYDVFQVYSGINLEVNKQTKKAIAILRDLIDRLTIDPLST